MMIRKVQPSEYAVLLETAKSTFIESFAHQNDPHDFKIYVDKAFSKDAFFKELETENSHFFVLIENSEIIGYFKLNDKKTPLESDLPKINDPLSYISPENTIEIERIYLKTEFHGKGFAQSMMAFIEDYSLKNNYKYIWLGVWSENPKAIRFYEKSGFKKIGEHIFYIGNDPQIDWLMLKMYQNS